MGAHSTGLSNGQLARRIAVIATAAVILPLTVLWVATSASSPHRGAPAAAAPPASSEPSSEPSTAVGSVTQPAARLASPGGSLPPSTGMAPDIVPPEAALNPEQPPVLPVEAGASQVIVTSASSDLGTVADQAPAIIDSGRPSPAGVQPEVAPTPIGPPEPPPASVTESSTAPEPPSTSNSEPAPTPTEEESSEPDCLRPGFDNDNDNPYRKPLVEKTVGGHPVCVPMH